MLILDYWNRRWQSVAFDTQKGVGRVRWFARRLKPNDGAGFAAKHKGCWYAVWRDAEHLVFQAGTNRWPMTEPYRCRNIVQGSNRVFAITSDGEVLFSLEYKAINYESDPTFDELDLESADFFYWVAKVWNDPSWRNNLMTGK